MCSSPGRRLTFSENPGKFSSSSQNSGSHRQGNPGFSGIFASSDGIVRGCTNHGPTTVSCARGGYQASRGWVPDQRPARAGEGQHSPLSPLSPDSLVMRVSRAIGGKICIEKRISLVLGLGLAT